jgi:hypothetical protein
MTFPLIPSSILTSWRQREYQRRGYTQDKKSSGSGQGRKLSLSRGMFGKKSKEFSNGTDSSGTRGEGTLESKGTQVDIELGGIEVTREVDVDSESRPVTEESFLDTESDGSTENLQNAHIRQLKSFDTPWLATDAASDHKSSKVSTYHHHSSWAKPAPMPPTPAHTRAADNGDSAGTEDNSTSTVRKLITGRMNSRSSQSQAKKARVSGEHSGRETLEKQNVKYIVPRKG